jgi:hypothetical protein
LRNLVYMLPFGKSSIPWSGSSLVSALPNNVSPIAYPGSRGFHSGRGRKGVLRQKLRNAKTYQEWKEAALTLDDYLGFNDWKKVRFGELGLTIKSSYYHRRKKIRIMTISWSRRCLHSMLLTPPVHTTYQVRRSLRTLRQRNDARGLLGVLDLCLRANFAGTESSRLYSEVRIAPLPFA